jgi:hypothetical protein
VYVNSAENEHLIRRGRLQHLGDCRAGTDISNLLVAEADEVVKEGVRSALSLAATGLSTPTWVMNSIANRAT